MSLACGCNADCDWYWTEPDSTTPMPDRKRRCRCKSCQRLLDAGEDIYAVERYRDWKWEIEEAIYGGDTIPMATWWLCEECGDLWLSLLELGYCTQPDEVREDHAEYVAMVRAGWDGPLP